MFQPLALTAVISLVAPPPIVGTDPSDIVQVECLGAFSSDLFDASGGEIAVFSEKSKRLYITNAAQGIAKVDLSTPSATNRDAFVRQFGVNSVAVHGDVVAACWAPKFEGAQGEVRFFDLDLKPTGSIKVGFQPDMIVFTPDGKTLLAACEAEPSDDGVEDRAGSISIIDLSGGVASAKVREANFDAFEARAQELRNAGVHLPMPGRSLMQQLEPEYIAMSTDGARAYVTLQEANAIAVVDVRNATVTAILPLGLKDFSVSGVGLDASDKDTRATITPWPVHAMYQPDSLAFFTHNGSSYLATANEGEPRDHPFYSEVQRVSKLKNSKDSTAPALDTARFPLAVESGDGYAQKDLLNAKAIGRLEVSEARGDLDGDGDFDQLVCFGGRSVSIWKIIEDSAGCATSLELVWDSGSAIERTVRDRMPKAFNADNRANPSRDARSDVRGPEPEGLTIANIDGRRILFVGLERTGGVMSWEISDPAQPIFAGYFNRRDPAVDLDIDEDGDKMPDQLEAIGDLGVEGVLVIPAQSSPTKRPILVLCNEVSGTVSLFDLRLAR